MHRVAGLGEECLESRRDGLGADRVDQGQRTDRVTAAETHRRVDVVAGGVATLVHRGGVVEVRQQQRARDLGVSVAPGQLVDDLLHGYS